MSRIDSRPTTSWPSTTTRCRKPPCTIAAAASSRVHSRDAKTRSCVQCCPAVSVSGLSPAATEFRMSRSVRMPTPEDSGLTTTAAPTFLAAIMRAASRSVCAGPIMSTCSDIPSATFMGAAPPGDYLATFRAPTLIAFVQLEDARSELVNL
jgi:hypothetical protein